MSAYVTNDNSFLDVKNAHLRVAGNVHADTIRVGAVEFNPGAPIYSETVQFSNTTTSLTTVSNVSVGGTLVLHGIEVSGGAANTLESVTTSGNTTTHPIILTNATTGLIATGNVQASKFYGDGTTLTGVALVSDLVSNDARITALSTYQTSNNARMDTIADDMTSNSSRITSIETSTTGDIIVATSTNTLGKLGIGSSGQVLKVASGGTTLEWATESGGGGGGGGGNTLESVTDTGNVTSNTIQLTNATTGLVATGNVEASKFIGDGSLLTGISGTASNLHQAVENGNVTSTTIQLTNATTGLVATGNVEVGGTLVLHGIDVSGGAVNPLESVTTSGNTSTHPIILTNATTGLVATGNVEASKFIGDGSLLTGITGTDSNLHQVVENGNVSSNTIQLTNATTGLVATGNVEASKFIGDGSLLTGISGTASNLHQVVENGNVTSNTIQLTNATTGLVATGNVEASKFIGDGSLLTGIALNVDHVDNASRITTLETANTVQGGLITAIETDVTDNASRITTLETANTVQSGLITAIETDVTDNASRIATLETANTVQSGLITAIETDVASNASKIAFITSTEDTTVITSNLDITGNIFMRGDRFVIESETKLINDAVIGLANNNTTATTDTGLIMQRPEANVALIHHGASGSVYGNQFTIGYTQSTLTDTDIGVDTGNTITVNIIGNLVTQNTVTATTFFGDGTSLTGIALDVDSSDNASRITTLETDVTDNAARTTVLKTDVTDNALRITNIETSTTGDILVATGTNTLGKLGIGGSGQVLKVASGGTTLEWATESGGASVTTDLADNSLRITTLETANTVQRNLITGLQTDLDSNSSKIQFVTSTADSTIITSNLDVTGNIFMRGERFIVESETKLINDAIIGIANNNVSSSTDIGILMQRPTANVALIHHGGTDKFTIGYTQNDLEATDITNDAVNEINVNILGQLYVQNNTTSTTTTVSNVTTMGTTKTFVVTVGGNGKYHIDGVDRPLLELHQHQTYIFDLSSSTLSTHPFIFSETVDGTGTAYDTNITTTGAYASTETRTFVVPTGAPTTLYYYCTSHGGMGASLSISPTAELNVSGRVVASGNVEASSFIGDGSQLTNLPGNSALIAQLADNSSRITTIATNLTDNASRIGTVITDLTDNSSRIDSIATDVTDNASRIGTVITDLTDNSSRIDSVVTDVTDNASRIGTVITDLTDNSSRIDSVVTDVTDNASRIGTVITDLTDNSSRIDSVVTDMSSNATRTASLETSTIISNSSGITSGFATGDLMYASANNTLSNLAIGGTAGHVLKVSAVGIPEWAAETGGGAGNWSIDSGTNQIYYNTAFVGIGTSDPLYRLDVHGTANVGALTATSISIGGSSFALESDLTDNSSRIDSIVTDVTDNASRIGTVITDLTDNSSRIDSIVTDVTDNTSRIGTVITDLTDNSSRIDSIVTDVTDNASRIGTVITDLTDNSSRIDSIVADVTDNASRIGTVITDLTDNSSRIDSVVADVTDNASRIGTVITDLTDNSSRIDSIVTNVTDNASRIGTVITDLTDNSSRIDSVVTDVTDNASRIGTVITDLTDNSSRIDSIVADVTDNSSRLTSIETSTTGDILVATGTNTLGKLGIGSSGQVLKVAGSGTTLEWAAESGGQWTGSTEIYFDGNVGIANTNPEHDLSVASNLYVDDDGPNVLVISGNVSMSALTLGEISIVASYGLDDILNTSNTSSNTIRLTNATTGLVATGNVEVGSELMVSGNLAVDTNTLFVDSVNNRVGVGTTDPVATLDVNGTARIGGWTTKTWSGNMAYSGVNTDINIIDMVSLGASGQRGEIVGELTIMVHGDGGNQQRAYYKVWLNSSKWGSTWYASSVVLSSSHTGWVGITSVDMTGGVGTDDNIGVRIVGNTDTTGQYYIKFEGPVYTPT